MSAYSWSEDRLTLWVGRHAIDRDVIEAIRQVLPYKVELIYELTEDQRELLNKNLGKEAILGCCIDGGLTWLFKNIPVWDRYGYSLFFRSEADFMVALMFIGTENLAKTHDRQ